MLHMISLVWKRSSPLIWLYPDRSAPWIPYPHKHLFLRKPLAVPKLIVKWVKGVRDTTDHQHLNSLQQNPLFDYAAWNWGYHACAAVGKADQSILDLLGCHARYLDALSQALVASKDYLGCNHYGPKEIIALHLTAYFRVDKAASTLLRQRGAWVWRTVTVKHCYHGLPRMEMVVFSSCCLRQERSMLI